MGEKDNIYDIIAAICPDYYHDGPASQKNEIKRLKKSGKWDDALKLAKARPAQEYVLTYDSTSETLEPVYFWILDYMAKETEVEKLVDNFAASPGSGQFGELQGRASQMQQEASRILGTVNAILKGVINLIYDLKEFKIRLSSYDAANSKDKDTKEAGILALKQVWMDKVDLQQRGQGSINALSSGNLQFVTLRDAFMMVNSPEEVEKLDLNDRVKRILKPRVQEFFEWKKRSEQELKKRYEIEKIYLKSQIDALKLNTRWAKPYLRAASMLNPGEALFKNPGLVTAFSTTILQLTIMSKSKVRVESEVSSKNLPKDFKNIKGLRDYTSVVIVDLLFRGIPSRVGQHYTMGGRVDIKFRAYALNNEELELLKDRLEDSDMNSALKLVQGMTDDSLGQLKLDIDEILNDDKEKGEKSEDSNPFSALFSGLFSSGKKVDKKAEQKAKIKKLLENPKPENYAEKYIRNFAIAGAINSCFSVYDKYKKAHGMATFPYVDDVEPRLPQYKAEEFFGLTRKGYGN